jgi:hypothetical protein
LTDVKEGDVMTATVTDPTKIGGCKMGDKVELFYMGSNKWMVKHLESGNAVDIVTINEDGSLKVAKTGTYKRVEAEQDAAPDQPELDRYRNLALIFKAGAYIPNDDLDDFDTGFNAEISINQYFSPNFALEAGIGYFQTSGNLNGELSNYTVRADTDIYVIPITANCKGVIPFKYGEVYLGGGVGFYYAHGDMDIDIVDKKYSASDHDYVFGGQILAGLNLKIGERMFIGVEGKQIFTDEVNLIDKVSSAPAYVETDFNLNGVMVTGQFVYRF